MEDRINRPRNIHGACSLTRDEVINFSIAIEELAANKKISHMEAVLLHCEETSLEIDVAAKLLSSSLKAKLREEFEALHFLPKSGTTKLPFEA
jgi:hypothetical protein